jgi:hypothetical protein
LPDWSFAGGFHQALEGKIWVNGRLARQKRVFMPIAAFVLARMAQAL